MPIGYLSELVERLTPAERRRIRRVAAAP
jgi:hypothetical protein